MRSVVTVFYNWFIKKTSRQIHFLLSKNFICFLLVGATNTLLDLLIFNVVIFFLVLESFETELVIGKVSGFIIASMNSYILNALFTFKKGLHRGDHTTDVAKKYVLFVLVSLIGVCINVSVMFILFKICVLFLPLHEVLVANVATLGATGVSLVWNYLAYRKFVFK